jgi:hypothetical protein
VENYLDSTSTKRELHEIRTQMQSKDHKEANERHTTSINLLETRSYIEGNRKIFKEQIVNTDTDV